MRKRTIPLVLAGVVALAALALWAAPEAHAAPFGKTSPVMADVYVGFGYGGYYRPRVRRVYYRSPYYGPRYYGPRYYRPRYVRPYVRPYARPYYYRPYYAPRVSVGFGYSGHRSYGHRGYGHRGYGHRSYGHRSYGHHGHRGHYGSRRTVGRRR